MKKKIIIFIFVISLFIVILSLSAFAAYPDTLTLYEGTTVVMKSTIYDSMMYGNSFNLKFKSNDNVYTQIRRNDSGNYVYLKYDNTTVYTNAWSNQNYRYLEILETTTLTQSYAIKYFIDNAEVIPEPPPPPPDPMDTVYEDGQTFLSNTNTNLNTILSFIVTNPVISIFTIGIFLISITVGILYRLNNKTTRKKS